MNNIKMERELSECRCGNAKIEYELSFFIKFDGHDSYQERIFFYENLDYVKNYIESKTKAAKLLKDNTYLCDWGLCQWDDPLIKVKNFYFTVKSKVIFN